MNSASILRALLPFSGTDLPPPRPVILQTSIDLLMSHRLKKTAKQRADDADARCARWLADGNEAAERGAKKTAEKCYEKSQYWLDVANRLRGDMY
jgi:hypothetical protein